MKTIEVNKVEYKVEEVVKGAYAGVGNTYYTLAGIFTTLNPEQRLKFATSLQSDMTNANLSGDRVKVGKDDKQEMIKSLSMVAKLQGKVQLTHSLRLAESLNKAVVLADYSFGTVKLALPDFTVKKFTNIGDTGEKKTDAKSEQVAA